MRTLVTLAGDGGMALADSLAVAELLRTWPSPSGPFTFNVDGREVDMVLLNPAHVLCVAVVPDV